MAGFLILMSHKPFSGTCSSFTCSFASPGSLWLNRMRTTRRLLNTNVCFHIVCGMYIYCIIIPWIIERTLFPSYGSTLYTYNSLFDAGWISFSRGTHGKLAHILMQKSLHSNDLNTKKIKKSQGTKLEKMQKQGFNSKLLFVSCKVP